MGRGAGWLAGLVVGFLRGWVGVVEFLRNVRNLRKLQESFKEPSRKPEESFQKLQKSVRNRKAFGSTHPHVVAPCSKLMMLLCFTCLMDGG